jgi:outer membrane receptor protein involved in Fe transport
MKTTTWLIALFVLIGFTTHAQSNYNVKGLAVDTAEKRVLLNASIMVLNAKDSTLRKFTRAKSDGSFAIDNMLAGKFILVLSYPGYADYSEGFTLDDKNQEHNFGKLAMTQTSRLLHDVIIKGEVRAIKIKGDTTEFNAKAYVIQPNDKVEDLIKQFPGIQVDKDGKITAQGQKVEKVLLDGEEFFGDDPTLVTKNIRADMVDKVQLYDKKSDQAAFTGIDDGEKTRTLNIKLKDGKKSGYFGKAIGGLGTDKYYSGQLMFNKFQNKEKLSVYGIGSNNGTTSLSWDDNQKYADGTSTESGADGSVYFYYNNDDFDFNGNGLPKALTGGAHYDNKWNKDKYTVNTNYKVGQLAIDENQTNYRLNNIPDSELSTNSNSINHKSTFREKLDAKLEIALDTTANLKITAGGSYKKNANNSTSTDTSRRKDNSLLNTNNTINTNNSDTHKFDASVFFTKKLKKKGRTLSVLIGGTADDNYGTGFLKSNLRYFGDDSVKSAEPTDQYKTSDSKNRVLNTNLTYTEPITKALALVINYGFNLDHASSDQRAYSRAGGNGGYTVLVDSLSNFFKLNQTSHQAGAIFNYNKGKTNFNIGTKAADVSFDQVNLYTGDKLKRNFINWKPQANFVYRFSQQRSFRAGYYGNTQQPTISQIQPVKDNSNPLYITLGNPDLTPSFSNSFNAAYNSYKVIGGEDFYISGRYSFTTNPIVSNTATDISTGKTTVKYGNLSGKSPSNYSIYTNYGRKIAGINAGLNGNIYGSTSFNNITNTATNITELNTTKNYTYSGSLYLSKYAENKFDIYVSAGPSYTINQSSLQSAFNSNGRGFTAQTWGSIYLPHNFSIGEDGEYDFTAKTAALPQGHKRVLLNANIAKAFFKEKSLKITARVNDIFNQNNGFNRYATGGIITEERFTTIKRYFMLTLSYDFSKMTAGATK